MGSPSSCSTIADRRGSFRPWSSTTCSAADWRASTSCDLGHRRIALVNGPTSIPQREDRQLGLLSALADAGLDPASDLIAIEVEAMDAVSGFDTVHRIFDRGSPTAVFCTNDLLAIGVVHGLRERGLQVPADVSVLVPDPGAVLSPVSGNVSVT